MPLLTEELRKAGFSVVDDGLKALWNPDETSRIACVEYGRSIVKKL